MAQKFLTDVIVYGKVDAKSVDAENLTINDINVKVPTDLPEGTTEVTVATSTQINNINTTLSGKQDSIIVEPYSGIVLGEDDKISVDTSHIATVASVNLVSETATAAKTQAEENAEAIEEANKAIAGLQAGATSHYEVTPTEGQTDEEAINAAVTEAGKTPVKGDTAVVKKVIAGDKESYTAYVYNGTAWAAMDGNYNASNVYLNSNIGLAGSYTAVGNIAKSSTTAVVDPADSPVKAGMTVQEVLETMFSQDTQPEITSNPAVTLKFYNGTTQITADTKYEVGTTISPNVTATLSAGAYTSFAGQVQTGVTASSWTTTLYNASNASVDTESASTTTLDADFSDYASHVLADGESFYAKASATHPEGAVAKTALGKDSNPEVKIAAGTKTSAASKKIVAYRKSFYGSMTAKLKVGDDGKLYKIGTGAGGTDELVTSAEMRALSSSSSTLANGSTFNCSVATGAGTAVFAYPATITVDPEAVLDSNDSNANIVGSFTENKASVMIADAAGNETEYKAYFMNYNMDGGASSNTLKVTI